jgi:hypothetical protein
MPPPAHGEDRVEAAELCVQPHAAILPRNRRCGYPKAGPFAVRRRYVRRDDPTSAWGLASRDRTPPVGTARGNSALFRRAALARHAIIERVDRGVNRRLLETACPY